MEPHCPLWSKPARTHNQSRPYGAKGLPPCNLGTAYEGEGQKCATEASASTYPPMSALCMVPSLQLSPSPACLGPLMFGLLLPWAPE